MEETDSEQLQERFRTSYARFLSQGLEPNDAVARALLELQQLATNGAKPIGDASEDVKMEDASRQEDIEMDTLKEVASTSTNVY
ncbi:HECT E3 ubiquitin ligase [Phytophthora palmivora]|uniref:HECT E3 ubiquitin ligase n=1 Tax=Phytophthora palmivora TaxID=4796 RepID=A0A2P4XP61_9STRA|nr:HECT E3 ubiquitin ligase [Phytophthora palmivora]